MREVPGRTGLFRDDIEAMDRRREIEGLEQAPLPPKIEAEAEAAGYDEEEVATLLAGYDAYNAECEQSEYTDSGDLWEWADKLAAALRVRASAATETATEEETDIALSRYQDNPDVVVDPHPAVLHEDGETWVRAWVRAESEDPDAAL